MNINRNHEALARKKRFVQSLTRSRNYLKDEDFLTPIGRTMKENTRNTPQSQCKQSTLFFDQESKGKRTNARVLAFTHHLCERCTHAIVHLQRPNEYEFVLCAARMPIFPTNPPCTSFKLDERSE